MKKIKTQSEFIRGLSRKNLNEYIKKCSKLLEEAEKENNQHNIQIYSLWLNTAINEARRRDKTKEIWLEHIYKRRK